MRAVPWVLLALALGGGAYLFLDDSGAPRNDFDESAKAVNRKNSPAYH